MHRCLDKVFDRFDEHTAFQKPINLGQIFTAATCDIITEYAFENCWNNLDMPDLNHGFFNVVARYGTMCHVFSFIPWSRKVLYCLPQSVTKWIMPDAKALVAQFAVRPVLYAVQKDD